MNGTFFILDTASSAITSKTGKYLCPYNNTWVLSKEPERKSGATYGAADEWEVLFDLQTQSWLPVPAKTLTLPSGTAFTPGSASIVDVNVLGSFADYVVKYESVPGGQCMYFRDRNVDGNFSTANYSVYSMAGSPVEYTESILGPYNAGQTYIKQFNNSVMLYPTIRMVINGNSVQSYSYTLFHNRIGTILVPFGDLVEDYFPSLFIANQKQYIIYKTGTGYIRIIRLGTDIPNRIERMAQYVHKINTIDPINILVERETRITSEYGSLDWNNKFEINNKVIATISQTKTTYNVNSAYNPSYESTGLRSSSMIISDTIFKLFGLLFNQETTGGYNLLFYSLSLPDISIDVFFDPVQPSKYRYTMINGIQRFNAADEGFSFPLGVIVPFPVGTKWSLHNEVEAVGEMSQSLLAVGMTNDNKTLDIYEYSNQVYFGQAAFNLFGIQYVFDGDYIYQNSDRVAMAFGYMFIGCDNNQAYFYNPWDKSVYLFNGSRSLTKYLNFSSLTPVKTGRFDGFSGEMVIVTEDEIIKSRENILMGFPYVASDNLRSVITATKHGPYIELADGERILLSPRDSTVDVFEVVVDFIGVDGSTICDYERVDVRLYSPTKTVMSFIAEMQTINQDTKESEQKKIELKGNDWSKDGYKTIKLIPQYKKGTGLSLRLYSEGEIYVVGIEYTYEPVARTAASQRSGY